MIVVDASVAVKWLLPEDGDVVAKHFLLSDEKLIAPSIIRIEVAGAVLRQSRTNHTSEEKARAACGLWDKVIRDGALTLIANEELFDDALGIAFQIKHDLADCLYLAAGCRFGAGIITADRVLCERGKTIHPPITLLEGIGPH